MSKIFIIALKNLKIDFEMISNIVEKFSVEDFVSLFQGKYIDLKFKYNISLDKYSNIFNDLDKLNHELNLSKEIINQSKKHKIKICTFNDKNYPSNLRKINNPPAVLYFKGRNFYKKHEKSVGCVGSRNTTTFGEGAVNAIVPKMVSEGFSIVSGLAEGIDTLSHKACLRNNGTTIAVLAHGLDMIYPKSNSALADEILENNGLLVSEYPIGVKPDKFRFVERNRIISGLSKSLIVFEAKEKSGTMHTANFTFKQNKPIFCPFPLHESVTTSGLKKLIDEGKAVPVMSKNSFETIVLGSGYKLKDKERAKKIKDLTSSKVVSNSTIDFKDLNGNLNFENSKYASIKVDSRLYLKYKKFLKENDLTNKDLFNAFMMAVIRKSKYN